MAWLSQTWCKQPGATTAQCGKCGKCEQGRKAKQENCTSPRMEDDQEGRFARLSDKESKDLREAILTAMEKRTEQQNSIITAWLSAGSKELSFASAQDLLSLVTKSQGILVHLHSPCCRAGAVPKHAYFLIKGGLLVTDLREAGRSPVVGRVKPDEWFGEEEAMSGMHARVFTTTAIVSPTIVLKVPVLEFERCMVSSRCCCIGRDFIFCGKHWQISEILIFFSQPERTSMFNQKIDFIASLAPFKSLSLDSVRKISPFFTLIVRAS